MKFFNIFKKRKNVSNVVKKEFAYSKITIFEEWLDDILKDELPSEVKAISFVIYEDIDNKWSIELGGAKNYDKNNDDWPCDFNLVYITRNNTFVMEIEDGNEWENEEEYLIKAEAQYIKMIKKYLEKGKYSEKLKAYDVIAVGCTGGDLTYLYEKYQ